MDTMKDESIVVASGKDHVPVYYDQVDEKDDNVDPSVPVQYRGTNTDKQDMKVLGKTQVLRVSLIVRIWYPSTVLITNPA